MNKRAAVVDDRQTMIPLDLPPGPKLASDEKARAELLSMVEILASAKTHPSSARLLGWQKRRFAALAQMLTPIDAAALTAKFEAELDRLGPAED